MFQEVGKLSSGELCLVRPGDKELGKDEEEDNHQDRAYRRAWASFDPYAGGGEGRHDMREEAPEERDADEEGGEEGERSKAAAVPKAPTARKWEKHMVSYWLFRNWCEHCARGKAKAILHETVERDSEVPIVGIAYMRMTSEGDDKGQDSHRGMPILMSVDQKSGRVGAWFLPEKGESLACNKGSDKESGGVGVQ